MKRLEVPLHYQILWNTGDLILRADLNLLLKDNRSNWHAKTFRVDTASDMTTMPAHDAGRLGLAIPAQPAPLTHEQTGLEVRSGYLAARYWAWTRPNTLFLASFSGTRALRPIRTLRQLLFLATCWACPA